MLGTFALGPPFSQQLHTYPQDFCGLTFIHQLVHRFLLSTTCRHCPLSPVPNQRSTAPLVLNGQMRPNSGLAALTLATSGPQPRLTSSVPPRRSLPVRTSGPPRRGPQPSSDCVSNCFRLSSQSRSRTASIGDGFLFSVSIWERWRRLISNSRDSCSCVQGGTIFVRAKRISVPTSPKLFLRSVRFPEGQEARAVPDFARRLAMVVTRILAFSHRSLQPFDRSISQGPKPSGHSTVLRTPQVVRSSKASSTLSRMRDAQFLSLLSGNSSSPMSPRSA